MIGRGGRAPLLALWHVERSLWNAGIRLDLGAPLSTVRVVIRPTTLVGWRRRFLRLRMNTRSLGRANLTRQVGLFGVSERKIERICREIRRYAKVAVRHSLPFDSTSVGLWEAFMIGGGLRGRSRNTLSDNRVVAKYALLVLRDAHVMLQDKEGLRGPAVSLAKANITNGCSQSGLGQAQRLWMCSLVGNHGAKAP